MSDPKEEHGRADFTGLVNLAGEVMGGKALAASDEFFAEKENLLKPGRGVFLPDEYTDRGKWMDGWESRRKREQGNDWCIIQLGLPGILHSLDIDTNHFLGNHPPYASVDAARTEDVGENTEWTEILPKSPLNPGAQNLFGVSSGEKWTHLRLNIYPDGGVARFRAFGEVASDHKTGDKVDLIALENGGKAIACSDMFFSSMTNLIMPGRARNMGEGWESRRRRGPGNDWVVLQTCRPGYIDQIEVDTLHFKGNYPDRCSIDACYAPDSDMDLMNIHEFGWIRILDEQKLEAHQRHNFKYELKKSGPFTHIRLNIYPDGGVSRLRVFGGISE